MWRSNIEGALDDPNRKLKFMGPRPDEKLARPKEVWKYDLHTSDYMRNVLGMTMEAEHGANAMVFWLEALHQHLCT